MLNKFTTLAATITLLALTACSENSTAMPNEETEITAKSGAVQNAVQDIPEYKIIEDTVKRDVKRTVEVELSSRTDEDSLRALAEKIYGLSGEKVQRTFIGYRIAGEDKNQLFWATTNYTPELEVTLLGKSGADYQAIKDSALPEEEVIGSWMVGMGDYKINAYKKDGEVYIQSVYGVESKTDKLYELSQSDKGLKLENEDSIGFGEYFIINKKGDLEFWGDYLSYTAPKA